MIRSDSSLAIRTAVARAGRLYFSAGGGIVADSDREHEYRDTLDQARGDRRIDDASMILLIDNYDSFVHSLARDLGVPTAERAFDVDELAGADEGFLTSSLRGRRSCASGRDASAANAWRLDPPVGSCLHCAGRARMRRDCPRVGPLTTHT